MRGGHNAQCTLCTHRGADITCVGFNCASQAHSRCTTSSVNWMCKVCSPPTTPPLRLTDYEREELLSHAESSIIYSASDGSVVGAGTSSPSSTFGVCIDPLHLNIRRGGKHAIRTGEESSLRSELEALIHAYTLIPQEIESVHAVDNQTAIDIHNRLTRAGLPKQRDLMHMHYHSTIARLYSAMLARGKWITITHTLSHLEKTRTGDPDLHGRRQALAMADHKAGQCHDLQSLFVDTSGNEDFVLKTDNATVEKKSKTAFAHGQRIRRLSHLCGLKMEGANHRAGATPGWTTGSRSWPSFLRTFRHKLYTQRLPTAHNRSRRGDTEDGEPIMPWCPRCLSNGNANIETTEHLLSTCPHNALSTLVLSRTLNNIFRSHTNPVPLHPPMDYTDEMSTFEQADIDLDSNPGWKSAMQDKHGRETTFSQGPQGRELEHCNMLAAWSQHIMRFCTDNVAVDDQREYFMSIKPSGSIDPHLLQGLASAINASEIRDTIPHNPFIPTRTHPIKEPTCGTSPVVISGVGLSLDWDTLIDNIRDDVPWVILASEEDNQAIEKHTSHPPIITLPKDSISIWEKSFWEGKSSLFPKTWENPINVYASPAVTASQKQRILHAIYLRSQHKMETPDTPSYNVLSLIPETPKILSNLLTLPHVTPASLQLQCGGISALTISDWKDSIPVKLHQKIYRLTHEAIVSHQHSIWIKRNESAHPPTEFPHNPDYSRKRKQAPIPPQTESNGPDVHWEQQRTLFAIREEMWAGTPQPQSITWKKQKTTHKHNGEEDGKGKSWGKEKVSEGVGAGVGASSRKRQRDEDPVTIGDEADSGTGIPSPLPSTTPHHTNAIKHRPHDCREVLYITYPHTLHQQTGKTKAQALTRYTSHHNPPRPVHIRQKQLRPTLVPHTPNTLHQHTGTIKGQTHTRYTPLHNPP